MQLTEIKQTETLTDSTRVMFPEERIRIIRAGTQLENQGVRLLEIDIYQLARKTERY